MHRADGCYGRHFRCSLLTWAGLHLATIVWCFLSTLSSQPMCQGLDGPNVTDIRLEPRPRTFTARHAFDNSSSSSSAELGFLLEGPGAEVDVPGNAGDDDANSFNDLALTVNLSSWNTSQTSAAPHLVASNGSTTGSASATTSDAADEADDEENRVSVLHIGGLFELTDGTQYSNHGSSSELAAALLAIEHVNRQKVIPGYHLNLVYNDTQCSPGAGADAFFDFVYRKPQLLMLIATGCSEVAKILGEIVWRWNLLLVSYAVTSPALSDRETYPSFFRLAAADRSHNTARLTFIQHFNWTNVATIHEDLEEYSLAINEMNKYFEKENITLKATESFIASKAGDDLRAKMIHLQETDARIIIGSFHEESARQVFCEAYRLKLYGARYVWMLVGWYSNNWWMRGSTGRCTHAQLAEVAEGYFSVDSLNVILGDQKSISGLSTVEFKEEYKRMSQGFPESLYTRQTYDSVWAVALTLRNTMAAMPTSSNVSVLEQFDYTPNSTELHDQFMAQMGDLEYMGVSGPVSFDGPDRRGVSILEQNQGGTTVKIALFHPENNSIDFNCGQCWKIQWAGGKIPADKYTKRARMEHVDTLVLVVVCFVSAFGLVLAGFFLAFNLYYRKLKYIKLSSPKLNNVAVNGCMLVYIAVALFGLDDATLREKYFPVVCSVRAFFLAAGFSLAFGAMFAKTFRVHQILTKAQSGLIKSKLLKDKQLLFLISALLLVDCLLISLWVVIDPMYRHVTNFDVEPSNEDPNLLYIPQLARCHSHHLNKWMGVFYAYKGLLLVFGVYMAWETRDVKIPVLNDSQYIGMNIYNVVLSSVTSVVLSLLLTDKPTLSYTVVSTLILLSTTGMLCLLFLPKIYAIVKHRGTPVVTTSGLRVEANTRRFEVDKKKELYYRTEVQNRVYKRELVELDQELTRMGRLLELSSLPFDQSGDELLSLLAESNYSRRNNHPASVRRRKAEHVRHSGASSDNDVVTDLPEISVATATTSVGATANCSIEKCPLCKTDSGFHTMSFKNQNFQTLEQEEESRSSTLLPAITDPTHRMPCIGASHPVVETRPLGHVRRQNDEDGSREELRSLLMDEFDSDSNFNPTRPRSEEVTLYFNNRDAGGGPSNNSQPTCSCDSSRRSPRRTQSVDILGDNQHQARISPFDDSDALLAATHHGAKTKRSGLRKQSRSCSNLPLEMKDSAPGKTLNRRSLDLSDRGRTKRTRILQRELTRLKRELRDLGDLEMEVTFV